MIIIGGAGSMIIMIIFIENGVFIFIFLGCDRSFKIVLVNVFCNQLNEFKVLIDTRMPQLLYEK